jgi:rod shape-determining protein MreB
MKWLFRRLGKVWGNEVAVDLGTALTLVYVKGSGIALKEPSVVAVDETDGRPMAVGREAKRMLGKTPVGILAKRPMKDGVITDFDLVQDMLYTFLTRVLRKNFLVRPRALIAVPSGVTEVERRAVRDSAESAGAREVLLVAEPVAAAVGIGLPIEDATANMVVDIGGGTTEIAVIALSGIVTNTSIRVAGDEMDEAVASYVKRKHNVLIGEQTAEQVKMEIGNVFPSEKKQEMEVKGRDLVLGTPKTIEVNSVEIREALQEPVSQIVDAVKKTLERTPAELSGDIIDRGIYMTGGGALLKGLDALIREETNLPVRVVDNPLECVVLGAGKIIEDLPRYEKVLIKPKRPPVMR